MWEGTAHDWYTREAELRAAGYRDHPTLRFQKEGEVKAFVKDLPGARWNHVHAVREGNRYKPYAHTEPHAETDPLTHLSCALTEEGINFGAGASMVRSEVRNARSLMRSHTYRESARSGGSRRYGHVYNLRSRNLESDKSSTSDWILVLRAQALILPGT